MRGLRIVKRVKLYSSFQHLEHGFSRQKQAIFNGVAKGNVSHIVVIRGEDCLKLKHCNAEELNTDIVEEYSEEVVKKFRTKLKVDIKERTRTWRTRSQQYKDINLAVDIYYQWNNKKKEVAIMSGEMNLQPHIFFFPSPPNY